MPRAKLARAIPDTKERWLNQMETRLRTLAEHHHLFTVYKHWLELSALSLSNVCDRAQYAVREEAYLKIVAQYTPDEIAQFPDLLAELVLGIEAHPEDLLGSLFHRLEFHNEQRGQFFTPWNLCLCMAKMMTVESKGRLERQPFLSAMEPCVGSGAMVLALATALREDGLNYQQALHVTAIDIDSLCVHMAYVQLALWHIPAIVQHGNTLSGDIWSTWYTPAHILGGWSWKLRKREQEQEQGTAPTVEVEAPTPIMPPTSTPALIPPVGTQLRLW